MNIGSKNPEAQNTDLTGRAVGSQRGTRPRLRIFAARVGVPAAAALALIGVSAAPASAFTVNGRGGGTVTVSSPTAWKNSSGFDDFYVKSGPEAVYRAPNYSGTQIVTVQYNLWQASTCLNALSGCGSVRYGGTMWNLPSYAVVKDSRTLGTGQYGSFPGATWSCGPNSQVFCVGAADPGYLPELIITWKTTTGSLIAQRTVWFNQQTDYRLQGWTTVNHTSDGNWVVHPTGSTI